MPTMQDRAREQLSVELRRAEPHQELLPLWKMCASNIIRLSLSSRDTSPTRHPSSVYIMEHVSSQAKGPQCLLVLIPQIRVVRREVGGEPWPHTGMTISRAQNAILGSAFQSQFHGPRSSESLGGLVHSETRRPYHRPNTSDSPKCSPGLYPLNKHHPSPTGDWYAQQEQRFTTFEEEQKQGKLDQQAKNISSGQE